MPTAPKSYALIPGPDGVLKYSGLVYEDVNGSFATVTTPWYINANGILVPAPTDTSGNPQVSLAGSNSVKRTSLGEVLLVGPAANVTIAPGQTVSYTKTGLLGYVNVGYFTDMSGLNPAQVAASLNFKTQLLNTSQQIYICGNANQTYAPNIWSSGMTGIITDEVSLNITADSANTTDITLNGASLGVA